MTRLRQFLFTRNDGSAAMEFALVAPILMVVIIGMIEGGNAYLIRNNLQYTMDQVARYAMLHPSAGASTLTDQVATYLISIDEADVTATIEDQTIDSHPYKHIVLTYAMDTVIGGAFAQTTLPITVETTVPVLP